MNKLGPTLSLSSTPPPGSPFQQDNPVRKPLPTPTYVIPQQYIPTQVSQPNPNSFSYENPRRDIRANNPNLASDLENLKIAQAMITKIKKDQGEVLQLCDQSKALQRDMTELKAKGVQLDAKEVELEATKAALKARNVELIKEEIELLKEKELLKNSINKQETAVPNSQIKATVNPGIKPPTDSTTMNANFTKILGIRKNLNERLNFCISLMENSEKDKNKKAEHIKNANEVKKSLPEIEEINIMMSTVNTFFINCFKDFPELQIKMSDAFKKK